MHFLELASVPLHLRPSYWDFDGSIFYQAIQNLVNTSLLLSLVLVSVLVSVLAKVLVSVLVLLIVGLLVMQFGECNRG